jgi:hypothetical protein
MATDKARPVEHKAAPPEKTAEPAKPEPEKAAPVKAEPVKATPKAEPAKAEPAKPETVDELHAGGYVDRGDGDGWVLEEQG